MQPVESLQQIIAEIRAQSLFGLFCDQQLDNLLPHLSIKNYPHGERIFAQGQPAKNLFILLNGTIRQSVNVDGREMAIGRVTKGKSLNLRALLVDHVESFSAIADEDCEVIQVPAVHLMALLDADPILKVYLERLNVEGALQKFRQLLRANDVPFPVVKELIASLELHAPPLGSRLLRRARFLKPFLSCAAAVAVERCRSALTRKRRWILSRKFSFLKSFWAISMRGSSSAPSVWSMACQVRIGS